MKKFKLFLYNRFEKKLIYLLIGFLILFVASCARIGPPVPLKEEYGVSGENVIPPLLIYGEILEKRDSVGVQKYDKSSWIGLQFRGEIDTTSTGMRIIDLNGNKIPYIREWDVSKDKTRLVLKPRDRLSNNMGYLLRISGTEIYKLNGEYFDFDGDKVAGEPIDDDFVFPFVTVKADASKGEWSFLSKDEIPPFISSKVFFCIGGDPTPYIWTDANIALYIYDYSWNILDTSAIVSAVDSSSVKKNNFEIVEKNNKQKIPLKSVTYIDSSGASDFGKVVIEPSLPLKPDRRYLLRVLGGISDTSGNKLGKDDSVVFEKDFVTFNCNHDSTECVSDTIPPEVLSWRNLGPSFEVAFSEMIDTKSLSDSSIYVPELEGELSVRDECGYTFVRFITSKHVGVSGYTAFVTGKVKDLTGNKVREVSHYFKRQTD